MELSSIIFSIGMVCFWVYASLCAYARFKYPSKQIDMFAVPLSAAVPLGYRVFSWVVVIVMVGSWFLYAQNSL
jgi:hypothetical protein